jgi:4,5:9,10-diseco-3-hydroxy-5,9,17-trioxoandrosta-1(10),2-diene-4-oate hydrolase
MLKGQYIKVRGIETYYLVKGEGHPLILIHGLPGSTYTWRKNILPLAQYFRVFAIDLKGFGYTEKPPGTYSLEAHAEFVKDFMDVLDITSATLVGSSYGGGVSMATALRYPNRVQSLVLIGSIGYPFGRWIVDFSWFNRLQELVLYPLPFIPPLAKWLIKKAYQVAYYDHSLITQEMIEEGYRVLCLKGIVESYVATAKSLNEQWLAERIKHITHPTIIIAGAEDKMVPRWVAERLNSEITNSRLEIIPQCGHIPQEEKPLITNNLIIEFLQTPKTPQASF